MKLKILFLSLVLVALSAAALTSALTAVRGVTSETTKALPATPDDPPHNAAAGEADAAPVEYVSPSRLWPELRRALGASGDRLEKPGKERLTLAGTLKAGDSEAVPVSLVKEFPGRIRLTLQGGARPRVIVFNRRAARSLSRLDQGDAELVETLLNDGDEHFFTRQIEGAATRSLGSRFRMDDGTAEDYAGPFYDIYQVADEIKVRGQTHETMKLYYFNSDTLLLERVQYEIERDGVTVEVAVLLNNWQSVSGQRVPTRIVRTENGHPVTTLNISSVNVSPALADGIFGADQR